MESYSLLPYHTDSVIVKLGKKAFELKKLKTPGLSSRLEVRCWPSSLAQSTTARLESST